MMFAFGETFTYGFFYFVVPILWVGGFTGNFLLRVIPFIQMPLIFFITYFVRTNTLNPLFSIAFGCIPLFWHTAFRQPALAAPVRRLGLSTKHPLKYSVYGLVSGMLLTFHLWVAVSLTDAVTFVLLPSERTVYWVFQNLFLNSPGEELFFRGFLFSELKRRGFSFLGAAVFSTILYAGKYLSSPNLYLNPYLYWGTLFFTFILGASNCFLIHRTQNIFPGIAVNFIFSSFANFLVIQ